MWRWAHGDRDVEYHNMTTSHHLEKKGLLKILEHLKCWGFRVEKMALPSMEVPSLGPAGRSSSVIKSSLFITQIGMLVFLMNWAAVCSFLVDPLGLSFKSAPNGHRCILSGGWVAQFCKMHLGSCTFVPYGQLLVWEIFKPCRSDSRQQWPVVNLKMDCCHSSRSLGLISSLAMFHYCFHICWNMLFTKEIGCWNCVNLIPALDNMSASSFP